MKKIALLLDYDGSISNTGYTYPFTPETMGDIKENTSIIDCNTTLWTHILEICKQHNDLELVTIVPFSNRQDALLDAVNSHNNESESFFLALDKIERHLAKLLANHELRACVKLSRLLLSDIYNKKNHGDTYDAAFKAIDFSREGLGRIPIAVAEKFDTSPFEETKILLLYAHVQTIDASAFYCFDDLSGLLDTLKSFYSHPLGENLIPRDIRVTLSHYDDGIMSNSDYATFVGKGERHRCYAEVVRHALSISTFYLPINKTPSSIDQSLNRFNQLIASCSMQLPTVSSHSSTLFSSSTTITPPPVSDLDRYIQDEFVDFGNMNL